jgi:hypothetical protein
MPHIFISNKFCFRNIILIVFCFYFSHAFSQEICGTYKREVKSEQVPFTKKEVLKIKKNGRLVLIQKGHDWSYPHRKYRNKYDGDWTIKGDTIFLWVGEGTEMYLMSKGKFVVGGITIHAS